VAVRSLALRGGVAVFSSRFAASAPSAASLNYGVRAPAPLHQERFGIT
jgi:hypothetical protein